MKNLINRHYNAIVNRGKITEKTKLKDFVEKEHEENIESLLELPQFIKNEPNNYAQETIDEIMVRINKLKFLGFDFYKELEKNTIHQETREN